MLMQKLGNQGRLGGSVGWATAFGSGHDPGVPGLSPASGSLLSGSLLLSLTLPPVMLSLSLSQMNSLKKNTHTES